MTWLDFTIRLAVAFLLGSVIGLERQWRQRRLHKLSMLINDLFHLRRDDTKRE